MKPPTAPAIKKLNISIMYKIKKTPIGKRTTAMQSRLLLIDDDSRLRDLYLNFLKTSLINLEYKDSDSGVKALEILTVFKPDLS